MTDQLSLPIIDTTLIDAIRTEMGVYTQVAITDGAFHRPWGNVNRPDRNGRSHVHGLITRCGIHIESDTPVGPRWATVSLDHGASVTHACEACFQAVRDYQ